MKKILWMVPFWLMISQGQASEHFNFNIYIFEDMCRNEFPIFKEKLEKLEEGADLYIQNLVKKKRLFELRKHFQKSDDIYEFYALLAPYLIPEDFALNGGFIECWVEIRNTLEALKVGNKKIEAQHSFEQWQSCTKTSFKEDLPKNFQRYEKCFQGYLK